MDAKWIPILAAGLGVLGGIGGAIVGGSLANAAQENQLESEQEAAINDLRRATHARYLGAADAYLIAQGVTKDIFIEDGVPTQDEEVAAVGFLRPHEAERRDQHRDRVLAENSNPRNEPCRLQVLSRSSRPWRDCRTRSGSLRDSSAAAGQGGRRQIDIKLWLGIATTGRLSLACSPRQGVRS